MTRDNADAETGGPDGFWAADVCSVWIIGDADWPAQLDEPQPAEAVSAVGNNELDAEPFPLATISAITATPATISKPIVTLVS